MENSLKISVVVTVYNVEKWLDDCLSSIANQTYKNLEVIVVNDCTQDNSLNIINRYINSDSRFKLINNESNVGAGLSRRYGIQASTGDYVILVDGDDTIESDYIERLVERAEETDADIVSGGLKIIKDDKDCQEISFKYASGEYYGIQKLVAETKYGNLAWLNDKIVRMTLYDKVEYCGRRFIEDTPTLVKLLYYANKVVYIDYCGYNYYQHNSSLIHSYDKIKHFVYSTLFIIDSVEFFKDKEQEWKNNFTYSKIRAQLYTLQLNNIKESEISERFPEEYEIIDKYISHLREIGEWKY